MSWFKDTASSLFGLLMELLPASRQADVEDIREAMLDLLEGAPFGLAGMTVRRVRYASDVMALWFLRTEVMAVLARLHGEPTARAKMREITRMFEGTMAQCMLPRSTASFMSSERRRQLS